MKRRDKRVLGKLQHLWSRTPKAKHLPFPQQCPCWVPKLQTLPHFLLQPNQFIPNMPVFYQYGKPATLQASPTTINPFYVPSPLKLHASYGLQPPVFPQFTNSHHPLASMTQIPYTHTPRPSYQHLWLYESIQPPTFYPPSNWQSMMFPYPALLSASSISSSVSGSL